MSTKPYITAIVDKASHDQIIAEASSTPTVIYVSNSSLPLCRKYTPQYEALAYRISEQARTDCSKRNVKFCILEYATETAMMFKFSLNQLPVMVLVCQDAGTGELWARTMMSPEIGELERAVEAMRARAGRGK